MAMQMVRVMHQAHPKRNLFLGGYEVSSLGMGHTPAPQYKEVNVMRRHPSSQHAWGSSGLFIQPGHLQAHLCPQIGCQSLN